MKPKLSVVLSVIRSNTVPVSQIRASQHETDPEQSTSNHRLCCDTTQQRPTQTYQTYKPVGDVVHSLLTTGTYNQTWIQSDNPLLGYLNLKFTRWRISWPTT